MFFKFMQWIVVFHSRSVGSQTPPLIKTKLNFRIKDGRRILKSSKRKYVINGCLLNSYRSRIYRSSLSVCCQDLGAPVAVLKLDFILTIKPCLFEVETSGCAEYKSRSW